MKVNTLSPWQNYTIKLQRRSNTNGVNSLGEPLYNDPSVWPIVPSPRDPKYITPALWTDNPDDYTYPYHQVRIEFDVQNMQFTETGERVIQKQTLMFITFNDYIAVEDRVTVVGMNNVAANISPVLNNYYIIISCWVENDSVGSVDHFVAELQNI